MFDISEQFVNVLIILGVIQGLILALFLFYKRKQNKANIFLFFMTLVSFLQVGLVLWSGSMEVGNLKMGVTFFTWCNPLMIPPLFYLYVKTVSREPREFDKREFLHFLPAALSAIYLGFLFTSNYGLDGGQFLLEGKLFLALKAFLILVYCSFCFLLLVKFRTKIRNEFSNLRNKQLHWLWVVLGACFLIGGLEMASAIKGIFGDAPIRDGFFLAENGYSYIVFIIVGIMAYYATYKAIMQPQIFDPRYELDRQFLRNISIEIGLKEKYRRSRLSEDDKNELAAFLLSHLEKDKPYLDQNLTLNELAGQLNLSKHILSQLINEHFEKNFFEFINDYRIEDAKDKLLHKDYANLTITAIAGEAGFKSKSTFYELFKKHVGISPSSYQKQFG